MNQNQNGYTFRGSNSDILIVASLPGGAQLLKQRICSSRSKFFPLRVESILELPHSPGKQTGSHKSCFPLKIKMAEKHDGVPILVG